VIRSDSFRAAKCLTRLLDRCQDRCDRAVGERKFFAGDKFIVANIIGNAAERFGELSAVFGCRSCPSSIFFLNTSPKAGIRCRSAY